MKTNKCPYHENRNNSCTHKFGKKMNSTKRKCGFPNPANCPLFLEWMEIYAQEEEKSKIVPISPLKNNTTQTT